MLVVGSVGRIDLRRSMTSEQGRQRAVEQHSIRYRREGATRILQELLVDGRADPDTRHATSMPQRCPILRSPTRLQLAALVTTVDSTGERGTDVSHGGS